MSVCLKCSSCVNIVFCVSYSKNVLPLLPTDCFLSGDPTRSTAAQEVKVRHRHSYMIHFIQTVNYFLRVYKQQHWVFLQQRFSTAGWKVSWRFTWIWLKERNATVEFNILLLVSLRSVCGEEGFLPAHLWPPRQHQHTPERQIPPGWWDTATK